MILNSLAEPCTFSDMSLIYVKNNSSPRAELWGTQAVMFLEDDKDPLISFT